MGRLKKPEATLETQWFEKRTIQGVRRQYGPRLGQPRSIWQNIMAIRRMITDSLKYLLLSCDRCVSAKTIPILIYHSIDRSGAGDSVSVESFSDQMEYLHGAGYRAISLDEVVECMNHKGLPPRAVAITFDDGYKSVYELAWPVLKTYGFTASIFVPTKYVGQRSLWNDPSEPLLDWNEIHAMADYGISFQSHGHSHQDLTRLTTGQVRNEFLTSKEILEQKLQSPVSYIAYPFSKSNETIEELALGCGYKTSFSVIDMQRRRQKTPFVLLRRSVMGKDKMLSFRFVLAGTYPHYFDVKRLLARARGRQAFILNQETAR